MKKEQEKKKAQQEAAEAKKKEQEERKRKEEKATEVQKQETQEEQKNKKNKKKATANGVQNGMEAEEKAPSAGKTAVSGVEDMAVDSVLPGKSKPAPVAPAPAKKAPVKAERASVRSVLDYIERNQLPTDQISTLVNSLLKIASEGGWSEARKTADSALARKLEDVTGLNASLEDLKLGLTAKITGLRADLNAEKSKVSGLKAQLEEAEEEKSKQANREKSALEHLRSQLTQQAAAAQLEEAEEEKSKQAEAERGGAEEARQALQG